MFFKKEIISLERPVVIKGKELKIKINERIEIISSKIDLINQKVKDFGNVIEGTERAQQKRDIIKSLNDFQLQKIWLQRLFDVLNDKTNYSLTITEAVNLNIIKDSEINQTPN